VWYRYKGEARQIIQYITDEQESFRILWNAWKDCVYINDTNQYTRSISAFINNLLSFLGSPSEQGKSIENERYQLMESSVDYVADIAEKLN
jgi:hypothetical protein